MDGAGATPDSRFQFSLGQLFVWVTSVAIVCALGLARINYLRQLEAASGSIPAETVSFSLFVAFLVLTSLLGLLVGPPLCLLLAFVRSRRARTSRGYPR